MIGNAIRAVFSEPTDGYSAVDRLRAAGFRIDISGSLDGDLVVLVHDGWKRFDEVAALVAAHHGRLDTEQEASSRRQPRRVSETNSTAS